MEIRYFSCSLLKMESNGMLFVKDWVTCAATSNKNKTETVQFILQFQIDCGYLRNANDFIRSENQK